MPTSPCSPLDPLPPCPPPTDAVDTVHAVEAVEAVDAAERPERRRRIRTALRAVGVALAGLLAFLALGNAAIAAAWQLEAAAVEAPPFEISDVRNFHVVDPSVWRGAAPSDDSYRDLAARGVTAIVDLRAEDDLEVDTALLADLGLELVHLPIRDGQLPSEAQVARFLEAVEASAGPVFVHCGAGVGRTGAMVAAYQVASGRASGTEAMFDNLAVGPPSLEQLAFAAGLGDGFDRPPAVLVGASRLLDAPRRIWTVLRH